MDILDIMSGLRTGAIRIPDFQREIVWEADQIEMLLDSVYKGYPLGMFLLWKTTGTLKERNPLDLPKMESTFEKNYLLDGQQRAIAIYRVFTNNIVIRTGTSQVEYKAYLDLEKGVFNLYKKKLLDQGKVELSESQVGLEKLIEVDMERKSVDFPGDSDFYKELIVQDKKQWVRTLDKLKQALRDPVVSAVTVEGADLGAACEIFVRLNREGTPLSVVDIMVAKTYADRPRFNLREKLNELNDDLEPTFGRLDGLTILECLASCFSEGISERDIVNSSDKLRQSWKEGTKALGRAIDFLRGRSLVPVAKFLPFDVILASLTYFFYKVGKESLAQLGHLESYFWRASLSQRYIEGQNSKIREDIGSMKGIIAGEAAPEYQILLTTKMIKEQKLQFNSSISKAILCFYATLGPRDIRTGEAIQLSDCFASANASQFHHVFPRGYLETMSKRKTYERDIKPFINSVANICLITSLSNKVVGKRPPNLYLADFDGEIVKRALSSYLISGDSYEALMRNEFRSFLTHRSSAILEALRKKCS